MIFERHPLSAEYKDLTGQAWEDFLDGFRKGILPGKEITIHDGKVLDGWQRYRAAKEIGVVIGTRQLPDGWEPEEFVKVVNDSRRHESQAEKEKRVSDRRARVVEKREEGKSLRTIAEEEGVAVVTVQDDLAKESTVRGGTVEPADGKVKGKDGKTRTANPSKNGKPASDKKKQNPDADEADPAAKVEPMDMIGVPIPKGLRDTFAGNALSLENGIKLLQEVRRTVKGLEKWNAYMRPTDMETKLNELIEDCKNGLPYAVCSECKGKGCSVCRKEGWLTRWRYEEVTA